ncbi:MAG: hypothetical protein M1814_004157 [Vezdaea aestivalis]|nr:MAG: hypothetical protein M1814_004157 [Vezdaea aestivalis]
MSKQDYIFSAPPPAPPAAAAPFDGFSDVRDHRKCQRGRGGDFQRGSLRGGRGQRGNYRGRGGANDLSRSNQYQGPRIQHERGANLHDDRPAKRIKSNGADRNHLGTSFVSASNGRGNPPRTKSSGSSTAPAVPSFNSIIPMLSVSIKSESKTKQNEKKPKTVSLGLIPVDVSSGGEEEERADEEANLSNGIMAGMAILRSGQSVSLSDPKQLGLWVKERRGAFPTKQRREDDELRAKAAKEAKNQAIEERRKVIEVSRLKHTVNDGSKKGKEALGPGKDLIKPEYSGQTKRLKRGKEKSKSTENKRNDSRADLLTKLKQREEEVARLRAVLEGSKASKDENQVPELQYNGSQAESNPEDDTSSSGSSLSDLESGSESDSDIASCSSCSSSGPDQFSSLPSGPIRVPPPPRRRPPRSEQAPCQAFLEGRCSRGTGCKSKHTKGVRGRKAGKIQRDRKGLLQKLVESEKAEEDKKLVRLVIELGETGALEEMRKERQDKNEQLAGG